jgi:diketogulonate reductase-like aldo/keto reductase
MHFLYGTAWKEDETERLVRLAIEAGFRGIDTANQRRHYFEAAVGSAVAGAIADGLVAREELFLQTKFTYAESQDHRLPYDRSTPTATQVEQSFASSLEHLRVSFVDSYVLHGPSQRRGIGSRDREAWRAMEALHSRGLTRHLGVSNITREQLVELLSFASVPPSFVQNRCYASTRWDAAVREVCRAHAITYQGFSLLTANGREISRPGFLMLAQRLRLTPAQLVFRFALDAGMLPLTGTTDRGHMAEDLRAVDAPPLRAEELEGIESGRVFG